ITGSGTVTNAGTITGSGGTSVAFSGLNNSLILQTGSVLNGDAVGSVAGGAVNNLVLQGNGTANNKFLNFTSLNMAGGSAWILNATSADVGTGAINGTLVVGDNAHPAARLTGALSVNAGGALAGQGTVNGNINVMNGGMIVPGAATAFSTLNVNGNVSFAAGSTFQVNVNSPGQSDKLAITGGNAALDGTLHVLGPVPFTPAMQYTILTTDNAHAVSGQFSSVTSNLAFLSLQPNYQANNVILQPVMNGISFTDVADTPNQMAVAAALTASPPGDPVANAVMGQTANGAHEAFNALSGEAFASVQIIEANAMQHSRDIMLGRLRQVAYAGSPTSLSALGFGGPAAYATADGIDASNFPIRIPGKIASPNQWKDWQYWTQALGGWGRTNGDGNAAASSRTFEGVFSGVDANFGDVLRVGLLGGYTHSGVNVSERASHGGIDSAELGVYVGTRVGAFNLRGGASYAFESIDIDRTIAFPNFSDQTHARLNGHAGQVFAELSYGVSFEQLAIEPLAGLAYVHVHNGSFTEDGGAATLTGAGADLNIGYSTVGLRVANPIPFIRGTVLVPYGALSWQHAFGDTHPTADLAFKSSGVAFSIASPPIAQSTAAVQTGLDWRYNLQSKIGLTYEGQLATSAQTHTFKGTFSKFF
ncbi:MAG TPA: autotransporter domain-containing protein, partial [Xanthobacteraceae bacterium]|nr:autotransporter domain-containing protein [Xanthobacteraceae bacterium]